MLENFLSYRKFLIVMFAMTIFPIFLVLVDLYKFEIVTKDFFFYALFDNLSVFLFFTLGVLLINLNNLNFKTNFINNNLLIAFFFIVFIVSAWLFNKCILVDSGLPLTRTLWISCSGKNTFHFYSLLYSVLLVLGSYRLNDDISTGFDNVQLKNNIIPLASICLPVILIVMQGTRLDLILLAIIIFTFFHIRLVFKLLIILSFLIIFISLYRGIGFEFFENLFNTFAGGPLLLLHNPEVILAHCNDFICKSINSFLPGFFIGTTTIIDSIFSTHFAYGHFDSTFPKIHDFYELKELHTTMNSYFTAAVTNLIAGNSFTAAFFGFCSVFMWKKY